MDSTHSTNSIDSISSHPIALVSAMIALLGCSPDGDEKRGAPDPARSGDGISAPEAGQGAPSGAGRDAARRSSLMRGASGDVSIAEAPVLARPWFGDYEAMLERRVIRALVPLSKTYYFLDGAQQRGLSYEALRQFEDYINKGLGTRHLRVSIVILPVRRDELVSSLVAGLGDLAVGNLTITPARRERVSFSDPLMTGVDEVVVTSDEVAEIATLDDLADREVHVRRSSSYYESLQRLDEKLRAAGKPRLRLTIADELLEDEDLLEMVNAGLVPIVVVDEHKATFWQQIFDHIRVHEELKVNSGGRVAWAFRKQSPQLAEVVNEFVRTHKKGTLLGNVLFNRYLKQTKWAERALTDEGKLRFATSAEFFQRYAAQYDFPWLLVVAQGYQESKLDQRLRSPAQHPRGHQVPALHL
jgi:membrane-bound lytic murein transglycosylase MltF